MTCLTRTGRCFGALSLTSAHRLKLTHHRTRTLTLGQARFSIPSRATRGVRVRLSAEALGQLRKARIASLAILARAQTSDTAGYSHPETGRLVLRTR